VGGKAWWWHSFASKLFFVGGGREKSLSACSTLTRCRFRAAPFLPRGCRGKPPSALLRAGGNPRTFWSGQQHRVDGASLLECAAWLWALWSAWSVVEKVRGRGGCRSSSLRRCLHLFLFGHVFVVAQHFFLCLKLLYQCGCYIIYSRAKACFKKKKEHLRGHLVSGLGRPLMVVWKSEAPPRRRPTTHPGFKFCFPEKFRPNL
jgi:hypothetical protein